MEKYNLFIPQKIEFIKNSANIFKNSKKSENIGEYITVYQKKIIQNLFKNVNKKKKRICSETDLEV